MKSKRVIILGATGMVGSRVLKRCLEHSAVKEVTVVGRRTAGFIHEKLTEVIHPDDSDYRTIAKTLQNQDAALFCLGAYTGAVSDTEFRRITVNVTEAFATALHQESPQATFCFLSGEGADQTERSRLAFARYKGAAEKSLVALGFDRTYLFRPGYIYPETRRKEPNMFYAIIRFLYPIFHRIWPNSSVPSSALAQAMVQMALDEKEQHSIVILTNRKIRQLAFR